MRIKPFIVIILLIIITPCYGQGIRSVNKLTETFVKLSKPVSKEKSALSSNKTLYLAESNRFDMPQCKISTYLKTDIKSSLFQPNTGVFYTLSTNKLTTNHWWNYSEYGICSSLYNPNDFQSLLKVKRVYRPNLCFSDHNRYQIYIDIDNMYPNHVDPVKRSTNGVINPPLKYSRLEILWIKYQNSIIKYAEFFADSPIDDIVSLMWEKVDFNLIGFGVGAASATGVAVIDTKEEGHTTPAEE